MKGVENEFNEIIVLKKIPNYRDIGIRTHGVFTVPK